MRVTIIQAYSEVGANFPFSTEMQVFMHDELSTAATPAPQFEAKYGGDFKLRIWIGARGAGTINELRGPGVYKKTKDVEYTLFLPYAAIIGAPEGRRVAMSFMLDGIRGIFQKAGIPTEKLEVRREAIIERICADPTMLDGPWPATSGVDPSALH